MKTKSFLKIVPLCFLAAFLAVGCGGKGGGSTSQGDSTSKSSEVKTTAVITVNGGTGSGTYNIGQEVTITATVPSGKTFQYWEDSDGRIASYLATYTFKVTKDVTYTAIFQGHMYTITVNNGNGSGEYEEGTNATVSATVGDDEVFDHWEVNGVSVSSENPYTFEVSDDVEITAITAFKLTSKYIREIKVDSTKDFKILNLTDIQVHDGDDLGLSSALETIVDLTEKVKPDMITFLGDILNDSDTYKSVNNYKTVFNAIDDLDIPWAPIFGNHDYEDYQTPYVSQKTTTHEDLINYFGTCDNCLFIDGPECISGSSNYVVNLMDKTTNKPFQSLIFMDSRLSGLEDNHAKFYNGVMKYNKDLNDGNDVESIVFTHIAGPQYGEAFYEAKEVEFRNVTGQVGRKPDLVAGSEKVFEAIKANGHTHNMIAGHDHENAYYSDYEGVRLAYAMKSSFGDNHMNSFQIGGATYVVKGNSIASLEYNHADVGFVIKDAAQLRLDILGYWRYKAATLKFDVEYLDPSNTGVAKVAYHGTNILRYSVKDNRFGEWNRLSANLAIRGDRTAEEATMTAVEGSPNKYTYSMNLTTMSLNTASGETACGEETLRLAYFFGFSDSNRVKITNPRYEFKEFPEAEQYDLSGCTIDPIADQLTNSGRFIRPEVVVKKDSTTLTKITDIFVSYENNVQAGVATVRVTPSCLGKENYKGEVTATFNIVVNPDDDTKPGHEDAMLVETSDYEIDMEEKYRVKDWYNSGKSLYFEVKEMQNGKLKTGHEFTFSVLGTNYNPGVPSPDSWWNRLSERYTFNLQTHTMVSKDGSHSTFENAVVTDLTDGWFGIEMPFHSFALNTPEKAFGNENETFGLVYLFNINRSFKIDNIKVI